MTCSISSIFAFTSRKTTITTHWDTYWFDGKWEINICKCSRGSFSSEERAGLKDEPTKKDLLRKEWTNFTWMLKQIPSFKVYLCFRFNSSFYSLFFIDRGPALTKFVLSIIYLLPSCLDIFSNPVGGQVTPRIKTIIHFVFIHTCNSFYCTKKKTSKYRFTSCTEDLKTDGVFTLRTASFNEAIKRAGNEAVFLLLASFHRWR